MTDSAIHVAVAVIMNEAGHILIARRPSDVHQGGLWEFPGGKQEADETSHAALQREIHEELGLTIRKSRPFIKLHYQYPDKPVVLDVWLVEAWDGEAYGREGQPVKWVAPASLEFEHFPPANEAIIRALQLPSVYLICPPPGKQPERFYTAVNDCIRAGAKLLQLRCQENLFREQPQMVREILSICRASGARLLLNASPSVAVSFRAHGVHLNSARLLQLNERPLDREFWVSASCHNLTELAHAERIDVDFVVLSPVRQTRSHPEAKPIGWQEFARLASSSNLPVYALGGMQPRHMETAWQHGGHGLAMLSGVWLADNPAGIIRDCYR